MLFSVCVCVCTGQGSVDHPEVLISVDSVSELKRVQLTDDGLVVGAGVTMAELQASLSETTQSVQGYSTPTLLPHFLK